MAVSVTILYPTGGTVPGHGGAFAWGRATSDNPPLASCNATLVDAASGGPIAGSTVNCTLGHPQPNDWMVIMENAYNGGKQVTLSVTVYDRSGLHDTQSVTFTFGAFGPAGAGKGAGPPSSSS
jgi:hypothetical protein